MSKIDWREKLGWSKAQIEELRISGFSYIRQGKYDVALPFFEGLVVLDPESAYDAQTLGALYLQLGEPEKAYKSLDRALKLEADHAATLINMTKALFMLGKIPEGLKLAEILVQEEDPRISSMAEALILAYSNE